MKLVLFLSRSSAVSVAPRFSLTDITLQWRLRNTRRLGKRFCLHLTTHQHAQFSFNPNAAEFQLGGQYEGRVEDPKLKLQNQLLHYFGIENLSHVR